MAEQIKTLSDTWRYSQQEGSPFLLLGEGTNVLFLSAFTGTVVLNRLKGMQVTERKSARILHVGAGENWHGLVEYTLKKGYCGLENLAGIPGSVGAAPVQNIGAYGVEFKDICEYVEVLDMERNSLMRLSNAECQFGYRDSVFKHQLRDDYAITAVGLALSKRWNPVLTYGDLAQLDPETTSAKKIFDSVCEMRKNKLPDTLVVGNAGSFFKNPIIRSEQFEDFLKYHPNIPHYPSSDGYVKLSAAWLIDHCHLKGFRVGGASVHCQQALVLVNDNQATPGDVVSLAREVRRRVGEKFDVWLEPEVRFIGPEGERDALEVLSEG